jgi:6-phosphofructokinase 1
MAPHYFYMYCLPACCTSEERFELDGPCGVLTYLKGLLERNGHAVICVAEGAGQDLMHPGEYFTSFW